MLNDFGQVGIATVNESLMFYVRVLVRDATNLRNMVKKYGNECMKWAK